MKLIKTGKAGTLESSDVMITISQNMDKGIDLHLTSIVEKRFGKHIEELIRSVLSKLGVERAVVEVDDRSALDCVIVARLKTAVYRAAGISSFQWDKEQTI